MDSTERSIVQWKLKAIFRKCRYLKPIKQRIKFMYIDFDGSPAGPLWGPNSIAVGIADNGTSSTVQIFPDIRNDGLRGAGKPMHFYIMPNSVRIAKNDQRKYIFHFTKFAGVLT